MGLEETIKSIDKLMNRSYFSEEEVSHIKSFLRQNEDKVNLNDVEIIVKEHAFFRENGEAQTGLKKGIYEYRKEKNKAKDICDCFVEAENLENKDYLIVSKINKGETGEVFKAYRRKYSTYYQERKLEGALAIKKINWNTIGKTGWKRIIERYENEKGIKNTKGEKEKKKKIFARFIDDETNRVNLDTINNPYIAYEKTANSQIGTTIEDNNYYRIMECFDLTLDELLSLSEGKRLNVEESMLLFYQVCHALDACHKIGTIHKDLKALNIGINIKSTELLGLKSLDKKKIFSPYGSKLFDFGSLPRHSMSEQERATLCSIDTEAPEFYPDSKLCREKFNGKLMEFPESNMFSAAIILFYTLLGKLPIIPRYDNGTPVNKKTDRKIYKQCRKRILEPKIGETIETKEYPFIRTELERWGIDNEIIEVIDACITYDNDKRIEKLNAERNNITDKIRRIIGDYYLTLKNRIQGSGNKQINSRIIIQNNEVEISYYNKNNQPRVINFKEETNFEQECNDVKLWKNYIVLLYDFKFILINTINHKTSHYGIKKEENIISLINSKYSGDAKSRPCNKMRQDLSLCEIIDDNLIIVDEKENDYLQINLNNLLINTQGKSEKFNEKGLGKKIFNAFGVDWNPILEIKLNQAKIKNIKLPEIFSTWDFSSINRYGCFILMSKRSSSKTALIIHKLDSSDNNIGYYDYKGLLSKNNFLGRYLLCKKRKQGKVYLNIYDFKQHKLEQRYDDSSRIYESEIIEDYAAREVNDKIRIYLLKPDKKKLEIKDIQPTNESIKTTVVGEINLEDFNNFPKNIELGKNELIIFNDKEVLVYNLIKKEKVGLNLDEKICNQLYVGEQNES